MAYGRYPRSSDDVEEASVPRIRRAERLLDMLDGQEKSTRARSVSPDTDDARALSVPKRRPARAVGEDACREEVANGGNPAVLSPAILSVTPEGEGDALSVVLSLPAEADGGRPRRVKVHLLTEQYADLLLLSWDRAQELPRSVPLNKGAEGCCRSRLHRQALPSFQGT